MSLLFSERHDPRFGQIRQGMPGLYGDESPDIPSGPAKGYEGAIKFYDLAKTVQEHVWTQDIRGHVLFAISRLESVPQILPIACAMSQHNRTRVHLAFMGRHAATWEDVQAMNGIADSGCHIYLHDARPDYPAQSSESRLKVSAGASLGHIYSVLRLQAVLTTNIEEAYFVAALRDKSSAIGLSLVNLPAGGLQSLSWISSLDAASLNYLDKMQIDIVIQAQPESSASLMRLLRSLQDADYLGWMLPRLTVEVPNNIDPFLARYLANFRWPAGGTGSESKLIVRHRLDGRILSPAQASMRTVESFYPLAPGTSHVLMLSPSVELSPNYFQFLMYTVLEYRHAARSGNLAAHLMGISLDLPSFAPDLQTQAPYEQHMPESLVLWQAPASTAALYFGDRWVELHTFLSYRLTLDPDLAQKTPSSPIFSHDYPMWLQPTLEMMQARGYYMLYPSFMLKEGSSAITVHRELAQSPEEFMAENADETADSGIPKIANDQVLAADEEIARLVKSEQRAFPASLINPLLASIGEGQMSELSIESEIPLISFNGEKREWSRSWSIAWQAGEEFAVSVGRCERYEDNSIGSLFCLPAA